MGKLCTRISETLTASYQLLFLLLRPNIVSVVRQTFSHILHFPAQSQVRHVDRMRIVIERVTCISLELRVLENIRS